MVEKSFGDVSLEEAESRVRRDVYAACSAYERMEGAGLMRDSMRVAARVADFAVELLRRNWVAAGEKE